MGRTGQRTVIPGPNIDLVADSECCEFIVAELARTGKSTSANGGRISYSDEF